MPKSCAKFTQSSLLPTVFRLRLTFSLPGNVWVWYVWAKVWGSLAGIFVVNKCQHGPPAGTDL